MFLTNVLLRRAKSKNILVGVKSVCSDYIVTAIRERQAEKLEFIRFDPLVQMDSVFKETEKIRSIKFLTKEQRRKRDPLTGV